MAAFNSNAGYLKETVESILNQTFSDFEFLIVDDGSREPLEPFIRSFTQDSRIVVYRKENSGLGSSLTYGISKSKGEYIARIDDDDVSVKDRLAKQVDYLDSHPEVSCVGGNIYYRYGDRVIPHSRFPQGHESIVRRLVTMHFPMAHTTLMYRKDAVESIGCYRIPKGNEDLDLLLQLGTVGRLANIDEYLTYYRLSKTGLSVSSPQKKEAYSFALRSAYMHQGYSHLQNDIRKSLELLHNEKQMQMWSRYGLAKRFFLIRFIKLFGKKYEQLLQH